MELLAIQRKSSLAGVNPPSAAAEVVERTIQPHRKRKARRREPISANTINTMQRRLEKPEGSTIEFVVPIAPGATHLRPVDWPQSGAVHLTRAAVQGSPSDSSRYLFTVRADTRIPSFSSNSLAMRSSPHYEGFSFAIRRINARNSAEIGGRPRRDFMRQNNFQPARCQRISVSGRTTVSAPRQSKSCDSRVRAIRVAGSTR
jgi:hypothetical protein